jgi:two-component system sensor histidine kinase QseC
LKLFDRYNRLSITATILIFLVGSCTFYFVLNYILIREVDETLQTEQQEISTYTSTHKTLPEIIPTRDQYISYEAADRKENAVFFTTRNKYDKEEGDLRELQFGIAASGKFYLVTVAKPLEETESLLQVIIGVTVAMIGLILLTIYLINRIVLRRLWKPFYKSINKLQTYRISDRTQLELETVDIEEFSLLNQSIHEMMDRIQQDYGSLKNFTGQAAHEMQTPLAVIRTKLDLLIQNEAILEHSAQHITDIEKAVQRLSRLHQSLLLLTKVEHKQFALNEAISLDALIKDKCAEYTEMAERMELLLTIKTQPTTISFHHHLSDILINNLLVNAIRYNKAGGSIDITLQDGRLTISNTATGPQLDTNKLFKPFYQSNTSQNGNGLGLSIVKQICDLGGFPLSYTYVADRHTFNISFNAR